MSRTALALLAATLAGLGAIAATVWIGARVREETVVARPYEEGLGQDADRRARAALGLAVAIEGEPLEAGARPLRLALADRAGRPVADAAVTVELSRPETSRGAVSAPARAEGGGRYAADVAFPAPGPWDVRIDVALPAGRVRLERRVAVAPACDLAEGPCTRTLERGGAVRLELGPRPIRTNAELRVTVTLSGPPGAATATPDADLGPRASGLGPRAQTSTPTPAPAVGAPSPRPSPPAHAGGEGGAGTSATAALPSPRASGERGGGEGPTPAPTPTPTPTAAEPSAVTVSFSMPGMEMGENRVHLSGAAGGGWEGKAVLVRCPSGRRDWVAEVEVAGPGAARGVARFPFTVEERR